MVQTRPSASFVARNFRKHGKKTKIHKRQDSHPSAENDHAYYAEVMQFSYQNTHVINDRSVFYAKHRSTTLAPNRGANNRHHVQTIFVRRLAVLTEVSGNNPKT